MNSQVSRLISLFYVAVLCAACGPASAANHGNSIYRTSNTSSAHSPSSVANTSADTEARKSATPKHVEDFTDSSRKLVEGGGFLYRGLNKLDKTPDVPGLPNPVGKTLGVLGGAVTRVDNATKLIRAYREDGSAGIWREGAQISTNAAINGTVHEGAQAVGYALAGPAGAEALGAAADVGTYTGELVKQIPVGGGQNVEDVVTGAEYDAGKYVYTKLYPNADFDCDIAGVCRDISPPPAAPAVLFHGKNGPENARPRLESEFNEISAEDQSEAQRQGAAHQTPMDFGTMQNARPQSRQNASSPIDFDLLNSLGTMAATYAAIAEVSNAFDASTSRTVHASPPATPVPNNSSNQHSSGSLTHCPSEPWTPCSGPGSCAIRDDPCPEP